MKILRGTAPQPPASAPKAWRAWSLTGCLAFSWRTTLEPPELLFADADGDGLTDRTEKVLGTDPAPRAGPARTEEARAMDEVVRYLTLFLVRGPVSIYADSAHWSGGGGSRGAGIVLHWPRMDPRTSGCPPTLFCADGKQAEERSRGGSPWLSKRLRSKGRRRRRW